MNNIKDYLISVIIPTFNGGEKLRTSINSIINQSIGFNNIELIIVDDSSNDKITKKILLEYQSEYPDNIKPIFMDENSGFAGRPRNIGIKNAESDYIIFLDDDDEYLKNAFELLYNKITEYDSDIIICNHYTNIGDKISNMKHLKENIINMNPLDSQKNFDILSTVNGGYPWGKIYKKEVILNNNIRFIENINFDDLVFYLTLLKYVKKITVLPNNIIYIYHVNNESLIHTHNINLFNSLIKGIYCTTNIYKDFNLKIDLILSFMIGQILLVFSDLDDTFKEDAILEVYNIEKYLEKEFDFNIKLKRKEIRILNNAIIQKKFKKAIFISNIYRILYNTTIIQKSYKKLRGTC